MTTQTNDGTVSLNGTLSVLTFERRYNNTVQDVWDAITNPERIALWWLPFDADITLDLVAGGDYVMRGPNGMPTLEWKVVEVEVPHVFAHTHGDPGSVITWTLSQDGDGCLLVLTQTLPDAENAINNNFIVGTHTSLDRLGAVLAGKPIAWDWDEFASHQRRYAQAGLATPE
jgi:uncharacterized protein YndB with AHSA1/START domain